MELPTRAEAEKAAGPTKQELKGQSPWTLTDEPHRRTGQQGACCTQGCTDRIAREEHRAPRRDKCRLLPLLSALHPGHGAAPRGPKRSLTVDGAAASPVVPR